MYLYDELHTCIFFIDSRVVADTLLSTQVKDDRKNVKVVSEL